MGENKTCEQTLEAQLRDAAQKYSSLFDTTSDGIWINDLDGKIVEVNEAYVRMSGFSKKELTGMPISKLEGIEGPQALTERITKVIQKGGHDRFESQHCRKDGTTYDVDVTALYLPKLQGGRMAVFIRDITERKNSERALRENEKRFKLVAEAAGVMVYEFDVAKKTVVILRGEEVLGYREKELPSPRDWWLNEIHPQDRASTEQKLNRAIDAGMDILLEYRVRRKPGDYIIVHDTAKMVLDEQGKVTRIVGGVRDVTERKQLQNKLEEHTKNLEAIVEERTKKILESEQSYRELYESFDEAFIATDWELNVIHWNKAAERITVIPADYALGKKIYDVLPEMASVNIEPFFEALQKKQNARFMMNTISRQTRQAAIFEVSTYPSTQGIIIIVEDKTNEEEKKRLLTIGQTAGMVGHDIRNPLQSMINDVYLLKQYLNDMPQSETKVEVTESLESLEKNIGYVNKIVADLQDYSKKLTPDYSTVNLVDVINSTVQTIPFPENITLNIETPHSIILKTDPMFVRRAVTNLLNNAIQAMPEGGTLGISVFCEDAKAVITVEDTGVGIPEEVKPKLFTPMVTTKSKGQGLGLAVVKRLVESLNGKISFESQEGKGTKFTIVLPIS